MLLSHLFAELPSRIGSLGTLTKLNVSGVCVCARCSSSSSGRASVTHLV